MTEELNSGLPAWAVESRDPYIVRLRELSGGNGAYFAEMLGAGAWSQALLKQRLDAEKRPVFDDGLELRALEVYADNAARRQTPMPDLGEVRASVDPWAPGPEDVVLALTLKGEQDLVAEMETDEAERDDDYGQEQARVDMGIDAIEQLMAWAGRGKGPNPARLQELAAAEEGLKALMEAHGPYIEAAEWARDYVLSRLTYEAALLPEMWAMQAKAAQHQAAIDAASAELKRLRRLARERWDMPAVPLPTVLATLKARWDTLSDAQRRLVNHLVGQTVVREQVRGHTLVVHRRISTLYERANHAETQALIEDALDRWEELQAARDDVSHPEDSEPAVQVSLDNQARFLDWVAKGAKPAEAQAEKPPAAKPWLSRPSYIHVLNHALQSGARSPRDAHNRAYAADTLRLADRIMGMTNDGFEVVLNGKGQTGIVPFADARVAFPYLPAAAKARMKKLHGAK